METRSPCFLRSLREYFLLRTWVLGVSPSRSGDPKLVHECGDRTFAEVSNGGRACCDIKTLQDFARGWRAFNLFLGECSDVMSGDGRRKKREKEKGRNRKEPL